MKFLNVLQMICLILASSQFAFSEVCEKNLVLSKSSVIEKTHLENGDTKISKSCHDKNILITSGSSGSPYEVGLPADTIPKSLSLDRSFGEKEGNIKFTKKGVKIIEPGDYSVSFSIDLGTPSESNALRLQVILKLNDDFDPNNPLNISSSAVIPSPGTAIIQGTGILRNVKKRTNLSLVGINRGIDGSAVLVNGWKISLFKINKCKSCD